MKDTIHSHLICCFCGGDDLPVDAFMCFDCHEYKGIMTVEAFEAYLHTTVECNCIEEYENV